MTMKKMVLLLLPLLLAVSCSLTDADAPASGTAHLRLLTGSGAPTTLSHPDYDDWSPQMVNWGGRKYLYFLSTRPYEGPYFNGGSWGLFISKISNSVKILRAEEVRPGEYSNLQLYGEVPDTAIYPAIVAYSNYPFPAPVVYCQRIFDGMASIGSLENSEGDLFFIPSPIQGSYLGGSWTEAGSTHIFVGTNERQTRDFLFQGNGTVAFDGLTFKGYENENPSGNVVLSIKIDLSTVNHDFWLALQQFMGQIDALRYNEGFSYRGSGPALFTTDGTDTHFGFYVSLGGRLLQLVEVDCPDIYAFVENTWNRSLDFLVNEDPSPLLLQRLIPLFSLTHYAGTIDKDPAYDQQSGNLFFASDREGRGKFNLYYVPKEYLKLPAGIIPAEVQQPLP